MAGVTAAQATCPLCGAVYPIRNGVVEARGELGGRNRIAADFYNGPQFEKFRFWELAFLWYAGGPRRARLEILRHLPAIEGGCLLEVGIGSGDNVGLVSESMQVVGLDIAPRRLQQCRARYPDREMVLFLAEGERVPLEDDSVDAALCVGGFNFFSDPAAAIREMIRVVRPAGRIVVADELPDLYRYGWGHRLRIPALDRRLMRHWFGEAFASMILENDLDITRLATELFRDAEVYRIWRGYGYCLVGDSPQGSG